ncbi:peptidylprolyl isomerase [Dongia sp.]|uniref:peptidylprolyl isomerase n=1 Tax=Dongia sp. TaxID=1977262 RepID=UPI0035B36FC1
MATFSTKIRAMSIAAFCVAGLLSLFAPHANAQGDLKIVAVVNEDVITELDLFVRMRLAMVSAKLNDTPETRQRLLPTLLRTMIDEKLKSQEAKRQNIPVSTSEVQRRIDELAKRNGMTTEQLSQTLQQNGIFIDVLAEQIRTDLSWARLVQRRLRSQVKISDEEIDQSLAAMQAAQGQTEYRLLQIFLSSGSGDEASIQQSAQRLKEQLDQGADFSALATEFSQDQGAIRGGDWGWMRLDMMDPPVAQVVQTLPPNQASQPIRGAGGYYIVEVRATRTIDARTVSAGTVEIDQILWGLPTNAAESEINKAISQANTLIPRIQSCGDMNTVAADAKPAVYRSLGNVLVNDLPPEVQPYALNQPIGEPSPPIRTNRGIGIFTVCSRSSGDDSSLSRVSVADRLGRQRLDTLARGYLSDLRRAAVIDIRL